jgi:hypothetical protein
MGTSRERDVSRIYKVIFASQGKVYEIYAKNVSQGELFGFVEVEQLLFGERSQVVVDPSEESLKKEFEGVRRFHVPIHSIVRVDEVEKEGQARVSEGAKGTDNVASFPVPIYTPGGDAGK